MVFVSVGGVVVVDDALEAGCGGRNGDELLPGRRRELACCTQVGLSQGWVLPEDAIKFREGNWGAQWGSRYRKMRSKEQQQKSSSRKLETNRVHHNADCRISNMEIVPQPEGEK